MASQFSHTTSLWCVHQDKPQCLCSPLDTSCNKHLFLFSNVELLINIYQKCSIIFTLKTLEKCFQCMLHTSWMLRALQWLPISLRIKSNIITIAFLHNFTIESLSVLIPNRIPKFYFWNIPRPPLPLTFAHVPICVMPVSPLYICRGQTFPPVRSLLKCFPSSETFCPLYPLSYLSMFHLLKLRVVYSYLFGHHSPLPTSYYHTQSAGM